MSELNIIFQIIILIMSIVIHELAHGYTAELLGDPTPRLQGRLTLNPIKHMDLFGSLIIPIMTFASGFVFGWAKPIEWNPYNIKNKRMGELLISLAGPSANLLIAIVFALFINIFGEHLSISFISISFYLIGINITLAVFNLIPIPPLDGSKVLFSIIPSRFLEFREIYERYSLVFFIIFILFFWKFIYPIIPYIMSKLVG